MKRGLIMRWIRTKISLGIATVLMACTSVNAQQIQYTPEQRFNIKNDDFQIIGKAGDRYYAYRSDEKGYFLDAYDQHMKPVAIVNLDFLPADAQNLYFTNYQEQITLLYQVESKQMSYQYAAIMDDKGLLKSQPVVVDSINKRNIVANRRNRNYSYVVSDDNSMIATYAFVEQNKKALLHINVLKSDLSAFQNAEITLNTGDEITPQNILLANNGDFYFLDYKYLNDNGVFNEKMKIFVTNPIKQTFLSLPFPLDNKYIGGIHAKINQNDQTLRIGAFYSDKAKSTTEGFLYASVNVTDEQPIKVQTAPVDERLKNKSDSRKGKNPLSGFDVKDVIVKNDGGLILVAEKYTEVVRNMGGNMGMYGGGYYNNAGRNIREYVFGDILAVSFAANGDIQWSDFFRKEQTSQNDFGTFSSYLMMNTGANLVFVYNENISKDGNIAITALDARGESTVIRKRDATMETFTWIPRMGQQVGAMEIIIPCVKSKTISFAKMTF